MRLCHFSDTHLGFRAFHRTLPNGMNVRENDVYLAFERTLKAMLELDPDLVIHSGDFFHVVRPSNRTIVDAFRLLWRFQEKRDGKPLLILGGNHETPRAAESGNILRLFRTIPGVKCSYDRAEWVEFDDTHVLCIPSRGIQELEKIEMEPHPDAKVNILTLHGLLEGLSGRPSDTPITRSKILKANWDYIALGDYHLFQEIAPNAYYPGATEFATTNIWEEAGKPKRFIEYDTDTRRVTPHDIPTRTVIDLKLIDAEGLTTEQLNERIRANADRDDLEDAIARQRIINLPFSARPTIDPRFQKLLRNKALWYYLDTRPPHSTGATPSERRKHESQVRRTLEDEWRDFAQEKFKTHADGKELVALGLRYLGDAAEKSQTTDESRLPGM